MTGIDTASSASGPTGSIAARPLPPQRALFDIPDGIAWLNAAYLGPPLRAVADAGRAAIDHRMRPWDVAADDFFAPGERVRRHFAGLIGASTDDVALTPSVTYGIETAARILPLRAGQRVLVLPDQFPGNVYPWRRRAEDVGAEVVTVRVGEGDDPTEALLAALDGPDGARVGVVAVGWCHWTDGVAVDLAALRAATRAVGAALVIDAIQAIGAVPFDVAAVAPDVVAVGAYKWLLGPTSAGMCYVAPAWHDAAPVEQAWMNRADSDDFAALVDYRDDYRAGARRFDVSGANNLVLWPMVDAALTQIAAWTVSRVHATVARLTRRAVDGAQALGLDATPPHRGLGHLAGIRVPADRTPSVRDGLARANVALSVRGTGTGASLRVAPHVHADDGDIDRLLTVLDDALR